MKKTIAALAALVLAGLAHTPASAAPLSQAAAITQASVTADVVQVRDRNRNGIRDRYERGRAHNWRGDRRYYRYRSWNRYGYRPYGWRSRGCIAIGPFWFCP